MGHGENRSRVLKRPVVEMMEMLMRRTVMERSEKFELTKAPKAEKNTTKRGRRGWKEDDGAAVAEKSQ